MRVRRKNRFPISLDRRLDHKLLSYTVAASAAGVSMMALSQLSQAEIVYTPTNQSIPPGGSINLDLNNDGITDFRIQADFASCAFTQNCWIQALKIYPSAANGVLASLGGANRFAQALSPFARVGPGENSVRAGLYMDYCKATLTSFRYSGSFFQGAHYLGLVFSINGQTHYGWARFRVDVKFHCNAHIVMTGYAYETIPGEPIRAGETVNRTASAAQRPQATLGALAAGSVGLEAWRRDEAANGTPTHQ